MPVVDPGFTRDGGTSPSGSVITQFCQVFSKKKLDEIEGFGCLKEA